MSADIGTIAELLTIILALFSYYTGKKYKRAKKVLADIVKTLDDTNKAIQDNKITPDEVNKIISDIKATAKEL